jgi:ribosomal protein S27E
VSETTWALVACLILVGLIVMAVWITRPYCEHNRVRCIHGDEILFAAGGRRVRCLDCGRALDRPLPALCTVTGLAHGVSDWREP